MIEKFFFGGVTPKGFSTQLTQMISGKEYYTYILKGGPGTGKSQMMKTIAERTAEVDAGDGVAPLSYSEAEPPLANSDVHAFTMRYYGAVVIKAH